MSLHHLFPFFHDVTPELANITQFGRKVKFSGRGFPITQIDACRYSDTYVPLYLEGERKLNGQDSNREDPAAGR
jgi:hypothetical protein